MFPCRTMVWGVYSALGELHGFSLLSGEMNTARSCMWLCDCRMIEDSWTARNGHQLQGSFASPFTRAPTTLVFMGTSVPYGNTPDSITLVSARSVNVLTAVSVIVDNPSISINAAIQLSAKHGSFDAAVSLQLTEGLHPACAAIDLAVILPCCWLLFKKVMSPLRSKVSHQREHVLFRSW